mgnify:CR=1 FL=1
MAKTITWKNDDNELCVLSIADRSSDETSFLPAADPFMTAIQESDDLFTPIRTSSGYIRIVVDSVDDIAAKLDVTRRTVLRDVQEIKKKVFSSAVILRASHEAP